MIVSNLKSQISSLKFTSVFYFISAAALFLYSYTQVDLSLTLSRASIFQLIEKNFQYIGYFNRPLSTIIYLIILLFLFISYFLILWRAFKGKLTKKELWTLIIITSVILTFSYNAFSYDIFNYIFDAKILTHYHLNPYLYKALDFPKDPVLSFMHWTHRTYPYGPIWLVISAPFSFIGFNYFLPTFYLFKILATSFFLGTVYFCGKIIEKTQPKNYIFNLAFFALNPLVIIEVLVSGHNDIAMIFFAVLGIFFLLDKKWILSISAITVSYLIKQVTGVLLLPVIFYFFIFVIRRKTISFDVFMKISVVFLIGGFVYVLTKMEVQPWYFLWVFSFLPLVKLNKWIVAVGSGACLGLLLRYAPFLYFGDWSGPSIPIRFYASVITPIIFIIFLIAVTFFKKATKYVKE